VAVTRVAESTKSLPARCVRDSWTSDLLGILFDTADLDTLAVDALARAIDSGDLRDAAAMPDESPMDIGLPTAAVAALAAAFELTRRATLPHAPGVIRGPADVAAIAHRELGGLRRECVLVVACDPSNRFLRSTVVSQGAVDGAPMTVREILNAVLRCDGRAFALAHNHPRGNPEPSDPDVAATERIADAARIVGLRFLGHVVVAGGCHRSVAAITESRTLG